MQSHIESHIESHKQSHKPHRYRLKRVFSQSHIKMRKDGSYHYRRRYGRHTIQLSLFTDSRAQAKELAFLISQAQDYYSLKDRRLKPFEELREQLAVFRDRAITSNSYNLIELLIEDTYEADRSIAPIADRRDLEIAAAYEQRVLKQAQELTVSSIPTEPLVITASPEKKPVGDIWKLVDEYCNHQVVTKQWSDPEKQGLDIRRLVELSGLKTTDDINKTNAAKFKLLVQERYSGTSVKTNYKKVSAFIQWIVRNTEYLDIDMRPSYPNLCIHA